MAGRRCQRRVSKPDLDILFVLDHLRGSGSQPRRGNHAHPRGGRGRDDRWRCDLQSAQHAYLNADSFKYLMLIGSMRR